MTQKEEMIIAVLECRRQIVLTAQRNAATREDAAYYEGKSDGYSQAIDLLKENDKSIAVELNK